MALLDSLFRTGPDGESRFTWQNWVDSFTFDNHRYPLGTMTGVKPDQADPTFRSMVTKVHDRNGPVSSAVFARQLVLSQVRFRWDQNDELTSDRDLRVLEKPGTMTRPRMLMTMEGHGSYSGNAVVVRSPRGSDRLRLLEPTRISFVIGSNEEPDWDDNGAVRLPYDWETIGIVYNSGNMNTTPDPNRLKVFLPGEYAHWMPEPDLSNPWRGASWLVAMLKDIALDGQISESQSKFFTNAMTGNLIFISDKSKTADEVKAFKQVMESRYAGSPNMFKNMFVGGVEDVKQVGHNFKDVGFHDLQGGLETRIAQRARIPPVIFGSREGQQGSALNAGNYGQSRRNWSDMWFTPTVEGLCETLEAILPERDGRRLSHDPSKILFLQEDQKDAADIMQTQMTAARTGADGGYEANSVIEALKTNDIGKLVHTGKTSVQLHDPNEPDPPARNLDDVFNERMAPLLAELRAGITDRGSPVTVNNKLDVPEVRVNLDATNFTLPAAHIELHERELPAPVVNVNVPEQRMEAPNVTVNVEPTPVTVQVPDWPAPNVTVNVPEPPKTRHKVKRDKDGRITEVDEVAK